MLSFRQEQRHGIAKLLTAFDSLFQLLIFAIWLT